MGDMSYQKIYGLTSVKCHIVDKKGQVDSWWVWWVKVVNGSLFSGCHKLSKNTWFVWSKKCYKDEKVRCYACTQLTN